ncbi:MAG: hypothetical protein ABIP85_27730 [Chthoniobacteraceae bacterium]
MPVTKIKLTIASVTVLDDCDLLGSGEWHFTARIDGTQVGSSDTEFEAKTGETIMLPPEWSKVVDVSTKMSGDTVRVDFSAIDKDFFGDDDLGAVSATFSYPFNEEKTRNPTSPKMPGGWLFSDYQAYQLTVRMTIEETMASTDVSGPTSIPVSRQADGSSTFSTVGGVTVVPRVEVCPVIPVPNDGFTRLPLRPVQPGVAPAGVLPIGVTLPNGLPVSLDGVPLNEMVNPSVIPILDPSEADFANKVARLAVTYISPGNLDTGMLTWHVVSGPAVIVGSNRGDEIRVRGTGTAADTIAEFEVRWDGVASQVLAKYRAWVGKVGTVPFRVNLLDGTTPGTQVSGALRTPAIVESHLAVAKVVYWQAGLKLVPDPDTTTFDGAGATGVSGVFIVQATINSHTWQVNPNSKPAATRYNFNPGVINVVFIHSILGTANNQFGVATDIQGIPVPGANDAGTPSNSWVLPSGIVPDGAAGNVAIKSFAGRPSRIAKAGPGDKAYIKARTAANPPFVAADMNRLYAAILPAIWGGDVNRNGLNLAHEMGHVLGMMHRGSGGLSNLNAHKLSDDQVNSNDIKGKLRGHPWHQNIMSYGYGLFPELAMDIDLLQAAIIRQHPSITY